MNRSRTFTRELNDPKAEDDLIIEELEPKIVPKKHVKRFKLNTTQIEVNIFYPLLKVAFFQKVRFVFQISQSPKTIIPKNYPELEI